MAHDPQDPQQTDAEQTAAEAQDAEAKETVSEADEQGTDGAALLESRIEQLETELAAAKDQALRVAAEAQNVRRRADQEVEKARKFALEKFVSSLLPVADSLEKAYDTMLEEGVDAVHLEGLRMTRDMQQEALRKAGVEALEPNGEPFDPQFHEAMAMVPNPEVEPNTVIDVMQKGYLLNGRVVRPAMVVVSKAP